MGEAESQRWTRTRRGRTVHADSDEHVALVVRTLGLDEPTWAKVVDRYAERVADEPGIEAKLAALAAAFGEVVPAVELPRLQPVNCLVCGDSSVVPAVARPGVRAGPLVYGRCGACGHGQALAGAASNVYVDGRYYEQRSGDGSGYAAYGAERRYREAKGQRLVSKLLAGGPARSLLEVGSGYGFTLAAARALGLHASGIDVNPAAARGARELYGFDTLTGTLRDALDASAVTAGGYDIVLYQFVLEHVADPGRELEQAARALAPGGRLVLIVPSMTTFELDVFGGAYRSLRGDHLHLFSRSSLERLLLGASLSLLELASHCSLDLLRGFLSAAELETLYTAGRGPDLTIIAGKSP